MTSQTEPLSDLVRIYHQAWIGRLKLHRMPSEDAETLWQRLNQEAERQPFSSTDFLLAAGRQVELMVLMGKSKDDLQAVIQAVNCLDFKLPLQFTNYR